MKSKHLQLVLSLIFSILALVWMHYGDRTGLYGCLIMAKLCAMQFSIEEGKEKKGK
jgi:hypothetical protein